MEQRLQQILESLPADEPRSRLEPYCELILRLRRQGRTYRRISQILAEKCDVCAPRSTLHEFVQRRSRPRIERPEEDADPAIPAPELPDQVTPIAARRRRSPEEIAAMRAAASAANHKPVFQREEEIRPLFVYDPDRALTNKPTQKDK
jgi:hypothetical protein